MSNQIKGPLKRRYDKVADAVLQFYTSDKATIVWWTKSTGQVVRNGNVLKEFKSHEDLVKWMEKAHGEISGSL